MYFLEGEKVEVCCFGGVGHNKDHKFFDVFGKELAVFYVIL